MKVLIIEDEAPIAYYIEDSVRSILGDKDMQFFRATSPQGALDIIGEGDIDLCLLDLNLSGRDGYQILEETAHRSFHTIIISAHIELAAKAFEYGVIDFVPKPFNQVRLKQALDRFLSEQRSPHSAKYLAYRMGNKNCLFLVDDIRLLKGCRYLVEAWLKDGKTVLLEKSLNRLEQILPSNFIRIHRSYITPLDQIAAFEHMGGSRYRVLLKDGTEIPLSRERVRMLKNHLIEEKE